MMQFFVLIYDSKSSLSSELERKRRSNEQGSIIDFLKDN